MFRAGSNTAARGHFRSVGALATTTRRAPGSRPLPNRSSAIHPRPEQGAVVHSAKVEIPRLRLPDHPTTYTSRAVSTASRGRPMRILFLTNAHNGMSQALYLDLTEQGHQVMLHVAHDEDDMLAAHDSFGPDAIVAPFLTKRVPERLWKNNMTCPVLIVHPGVRGDRGVSSIDWALKDYLPEWGVTILQADEKMDAGAVWKSCKFSVPHSSTLTKSAFYNKLCVPAAVTSVRAAIDKLQHGVPPRPLNYRHTDVIGTLRPTMKLADRAVDWTTMLAEEAARVVRYSDSSPGCPHTFRSIKYRLFGAYPEADGADGERTACETGKLLKKSGAEPGEPVGQRNGAVLFKCSGGTGLWISHMRRNSNPITNTLHQDQVPSFKQPSTSVLPKHVVDGLPCIPEPPLYIPFGEKPSTFQEVWVSIDRGVAWVHSDFYNGAASTSQCQRLTAAIQEVGQLDTVKVVLLMGGEHSYGNGINLNTIEASADPDIESWLNINAINDSIKAGFSILDKVVVSVMRGNAGAGGAMAAMASDLVWANENVILNPHYKAMELTGSEYWTYFVERRVGRDVALALTGDTRPITASQAHAIGMVDSLLLYSPSSTFGEEVGLASVGNDTVKHAAHYLRAIRDRAELLVASGQADKIIAEKKRDRNDAWFEKVERHRASEILRMRECFSSPWYHDARRRFVYKTPTLSTTPTHMVREASIPALPLDGRLAAKVIRQQIKERIDKLAAEANPSADGTEWGGRVPGLGIVMANGRADSSIYVDAKIRAANETGMKTTLVDIPTGGLSPTALETKLLAEVHALNERDDIDGIVVQMPLQAGVNSNKVAKAIAVHKDADACHPDNGANVLNGEAWSSDMTSRGSAEDFRPLSCTPHGIVVLLAMHGVRVVGQTAVVIGKSRMVGTPMAALLSNGGATVTQCDAHTEKTTLERKVRNADIVVSAAGRAGLVEGHWIRPGAVVVDVAMNTQGVTPSGRRKVVGDVDFAKAQSKASYITPVPGGVGPMTVALLLQNTLKLFEAHGIRRPYSAGIQSASI